MGPGTYFVSTEDSMSASAVLAILACVCAATSGFTYHDFDSCKYHVCFFGKCEVEIEA
jgi:hypothetical protein